ncbi:PLxRFG domain-containing protein [Vibrio sp. TBV020]|uniref:PLxRFG domain-containing protein n=1 Tax=Vibrio sp. TBV020 TaxID=3137398 RepID=UPI0038CD5950
MYRSPIRNLNFGTAPDDSVDTQGMVGDFVDSVQRGLYQGMAGTFETVDQLTGFGGGIRDWLNTQADKQISEMSEAGQNALTQEIFTEDENGKLTLGEGATNAATWLNYLGQGIGTVGSFIGTGGAGGMIAKGGARLLTTATGKKALQEAAKKEASKLGFKGKARDFVANAAISVTVGNGMIANNEREKFKNLSFTELQNSPAFSDMFWKMREDPENQQLSDQEVGLAAREALAEAAADRAYYDPKITAVNTIGGLAGAVGGRGLGITNNLFQPGKTAKTGLVKGATIEGVQESGQGGVEAYVSNEIYRDFVNPEHDVMDGVVSGALNEGVIGGMLGGTTGTVEGYKNGRKSKAIEPPAELSSPEVVHQEEPVEQRTPEQRAIEEPITGNTSLDTELNRLDDSNSAASAALEGSKERQIENALSAKRQASRLSLQERGVLPERNAEQDTLELAQAYNPERYQEIVQELSDPAIDNVPDYAQQLEDELLSLAEQAKQMDIDPLQTNVDRRVAANRVSPDVQQKIRQRLSIYQDNGVVADKESAIAALDQPASENELPLAEQSLVDTESSKQLKAELEQAQMDSEIRSQYGLEEDYQPTETAQRIREEQGIALRDKLDYLDDKPRVEAITPSEGPTQQAHAVHEKLANQDIELNQQSIESRRDYDMAKNQLDEPGNPVNDDLLNHLPPERVSNFSDRPASMKLREEGKKPIKDLASMMQKTKGMSKRLKRRIQRAKGFDTNAVLKEFQQNEKRLQAYEQEAKEQARIEANKPENVARRQSAEALFADKMESAEAAEFKENLITSTMNEVNKIVDESQGTVLEIDGQEVSLPEVKRQLSNGVRTLANKFIGKTASMNERLRAHRQQNEVSNESESNVQPDPEPVQEAPPANADQQTDQESETNYSPEVAKERASEVDDSQQEADSSIDKEPTNQTSNNDQANNKIEDFGETLHGARKHTWGAFGDSLNKDFTQEEMKSEPLSKLLPKPNYKKLSKEGVSNFNLAMVAVLRGAIPSKPRKTYRLDRWVQAVDSTRSVLKLAMDNDPRLDDSPFHKSTMGQLLQSIADDLTIEQIETLGNFEANYYNISKNYTFKRKKSYGRESVEAKTMEELNDKALQLLNNNQQQSTTSTPKKRVDMGVYVKRFTGEVFIGVKVGSRVVEIKSGFDSTKQAREYMAENQIALEDEVITRRNEARQQVRADTNRPRDGIVEREGDVTPEDFSKAFGFRGVQFGNWVEGKRRQQDLNNAYDSLVDLANLMGVTTRAISLGGKLGLAFGARGQGGRSSAAAHFEPGTFVINLTKVHGKGSLAHEWFHALDYHFGNGINVSGRKSASTVEGVRPEMAEKWDNIKKAIHDSKLPERSGKRDELRSKGYWNTDVELVARAFETWVIEQNSHNGITNDYLANVLPHDNQEDYPYPTAKEMERGISEAYSEFAKSIKEDAGSDGNVTLYRLDASQTSQIDSDPTTKQVKEFVKSIFKGSPDLAHAEKLVEVVGSEQDLPNHIRYQIMNDGVEGKVNGLYDPHSERVYLIAPKIPTKEHAERFIFHELVGHHGLRSLFGDEINKELANIRNLLGGKSGVLSLARKMNVDLGAYINVTDRAVANNEISTEQSDYILFDELLAHVAESKRVSSALDRLILKLKNWLRRHGFESLAKYGKSDLLELLTNIRTSLNNPPPSNPPGSKKGRVNYSLDVQPSVDQVLNTKQTDLVKRIKSAIGGFAPIEALGRNKYAMLTLRQIGEVAGFIDKDLEKMIDGYQQEVNSMVSTQNTLAEEAATISDDLSKWAKKNRKAADQLFEFAHDATLADVDPSKPFESRTEDLKQEIERLERAYKEYGGHNSERGSAIFEELKELRQILKQEPNRQKEHVRLKPVWGRLTKEQKAKFREMRDYYTKQGERFDKSLEENINRAVEDQKIRKEMLAKLRQRQEVRAKGLYFPLSRFGDYWIDFADKNGERQYMMFESKSEMEAARDKLRDAGFEVKSGMKAQGNEGQQVSLPFVADVMNLIRSSKMNQHNADTLSDQVYQMYLRTLPGRSLRRNFIHRKGVEGFSNDAIRVLADNGFKQSRQQARLDHMDILDNHLVNIKKYSDTATDNAEISRITEEMDKRHEWVRNPHRSAWAQKLTSIGFSWLLGLTPAAALVNLTQNLQVAIPVLGSKHGFAKSSAVMANTSKEFLKAASKALTGSERKRGYGVMGNHLSGQELDAFRQAVKQGVIDTTQAADLAGLAENPNAKYSGAWNKAMNVIGWSFHNAEVFNREVTFMSAYRLAKEKYGDHQKAVDEAIKDTWESHFDYTSTNRARFMQSDLAAVALQFKQYSQNMTYYLWSNLAKSLKGESPEVKSQARKQLLSTLAMTFGIGGLGALPLSALTIAVDAAQAAFGDDDEPWSAEVELKSMLSQAVGNENAALLWYGSLPSISGRISLNDLWVRSIDRDIDTDQRYLEYIKQGLGPVLGGIGFSFARGLSDIGDDFGIRSAEQMSPKVVKDMLKMARYINEEGVYTRSGAQVIGDMSAAELAAQALGFSSGRANIQYDENSAIKNYEVHLTKRRSQLVNGYYTAYRLGDKNAMKEVMEKIQKWNKSKYGRMNPITNDSIKRSIKARLNNLKKTNSGLRINDKYQSLINEYDFF